METKEAIYKRRSVRKFTDRMVSDAEITEILLAARMAPSWANTQCWEFIVIRDRELIRKIAGTYSETNPAVKCTQSASVLIAVCAKKGISGTKNGVDATKFSTWYMFDAGIAAQNICLAAHDMGLGTVIVSLFNHDECARILSVPEGYEVLSIIPVGESASPGKEGPPRREIKDMCHLNRFGTEFIPAE